MNEQVKKNIMEYKQKYLQKLTDAQVPEKLEKQINLQKKTNADLLFTGSAFMDADGKPIDWYLAAPAEVTSGCCV